MKQNLKSFLLMGAGTLVVTAAAVAGQGGVASAETAQAQATEPTTVKHGQKLSIYWMRYQFDVLLREHVSISVQALKADHLNQPDEEAILRTLGRNNRALAKTVNRAYPDTKEQFLELWAAQTDHYKAYLKAAEAHDEDGKKEAKAKLAEFSHKLSELLASKSDRLDEDWFQKLLEAHGHKMMSIIDKLVDEDYKAAHAQASQAYRLIGHIAHTLAHGMPKQNW